MINHTDLTSHLNFPCNLLPNDSAHFYNSKGFIQNEMQILATSIKIMQKELDGGLKQIQDAINGLT